MSVNHYDLRHYYKSMARILDREVRTGQRRPGMDCTRAAALAIEDCEAEGRVTPKEINSAVENVLRAFMENVEERVQARKEEYLREMRMRRGKIVHDEWEEEEHPRDDGGRFTVKGTGRSRGNSERNTPRARTETEHLSSLRSDRGRELMMPGHKNPDAGQKNYQQPDRARELMLQGHGQAQQREISEVSQRTFTSTLLKAFGNVPKSGMQFVGDLLNAMLSPFETGEGIIRIIAGYACQVTGEERKYRIYSDAMTQYFMERYGSMEKFIETLEKDPVGLAGDISIFFTAGAGVLKTLAKGGTVAARALPTGSTLARGAQTASGVAERTATAVGAAGNTVDPLYVPGKVAGKAAQALSRSPQTRNVGRLGTLFSRSRSMLRGAKNASGIGGTQKAIERGSENDME